MSILVYLLCALLCLTPSHAWFDSEHMELFDLVEEVKQNFYEFMEINETATASDVKKAFRQLSLKLHPDKTDEPDADVKFRQLVSISEVLKDETKRKKYDDILVNGLPDWRSGIYYIRRARKLGLLEMSIIVSVLLTLGHYLCLVAAYYEKVFEVNEVLKKKKEKLKKAEFDNVYKETLENFGAKKPEIWQDNLPVQTVRGTYNFFIFGLPGYIKSTITDYYERVEERKRQAEEEAQQREPEAPRVKRPKAKVELPEYSDIYSNEADSLEDTNPVEHSATNSYALKVDIWSDEEVHQLIKLNKKFPPGVPQRWEKIAIALGRSLDDVTKKAKILKTGELKVKETLLENKSAPPIQPSNEISTRDDDSADNAANWKQEDQVLFEKALLTYPKGVDARWDKIAEAVPGKSKEDCILRFKWLSELVKKKRAEANETSKGK